MRMLREWRSWEINRKDQLILFQRAVELGMIAGQPMKLCDGNLPLTFPAAHPDCSIQRSQGHAHIGRMHGNALLARAKNRMAPIVPFKSAASAARVSFVALL